MGIEIERKFLVNKKIWNAIEKTDKEYINQGYILISSDKTIRIRRTDNNSYLTIKGSKKNATRFEFEYIIPEEDASQLIELFSISILSKNRYKIKFKNCLWEVDEFLEDNLGLIIAEIELKNETEEFEIPDWIEKEVTTDERYYNSYLSTHPFKYW